MRSLIQLSLEALAANIKRLRSLQGISEELAIELFDLVLRQGALTPEVLALFEDTGHGELLDHIQALHLRPMPVVLRTTSHRWLGDRSNLY